MREGAAFRCKKQRSPSGTSGHREERNKGDHYTNAWWALWVLIIPLCCLAFCIWSACRARKASAASYYTSPHPGVAMQSLPGGGGGDTATGYPVKPTYGGVPPTGGAASPPGGPMYGSGGPPVYGGGGAPMYGPPPPQQQGGGGFNPLLAGGAGFLGGALLGNALGGGGHGWGGGGWDHGGWDGGGGGGGDGGTFAADTGGFDGGGGGGDSFAAGS